MAIQDLKSQITSLPEQPGVYLFFGAAGETLYVGKAASLRDRVRSYLAAWGTSPRIDALLGDAVRLEVIVTDSVVEALALENNLIKQRMPRYNIRLRDDKHYPYLQLTVTETYPRVLVARGAERDGNVYAGPFMPASLARRMRTLSHRLFGIRSCNEELNGRRDRPCLEYDIGRCLAPCVEQVCSRDAYGQAVGRARLFLEGNNAELEGQLQDEMQRAAGNERYEHAAHLRDAIRTLQTLRGRQQKMESAALGDRDAFGVKTGPSGSVIQVFQMRGGRVIERVELAAEAEHGDMEPEPEVLQAAVALFYEDRGIPPEVHVPVALPDGAILEAWMSARAGRRVSIVVPRRQDRRGLLELATRNAALAYQSRFGSGRVANFEALETLRDLLALPQFPRRIECFDISTLQGTNTVASMVVCEDGRMRRSEYRTFTVRAARGVGQPDDFAAMREVVFRRYQRVVDRAERLPDLILIDGGAGQLSSAYESLTLLGQESLVAVGLAKKEELIVTRHTAEPLALPPSHPSLLLLQRIRDEAHRFAITFHRHARGRRTLRSEVDNIPGIGPRRRKVLLERFGSVAGVRRASREALTAAVGAKAADAVLAHFARGQTLN
jgi:excinuclease ABC subunit C